MGQKVHPVGFRLGITKDWESRWFATGKEYIKYLHEDIAIREYIKRKYFREGISRIEIERKTAQKVRITIYTSRPGVVIGRQGSEIEALRKDLEKMIGRQIIINVKNIDKPDLDARIVAENIAFQIEKRMPYRRAMKQAILRAMKAGAQGIKVQVSGRLGGAEVARSEWLKEGKLSLQTLRSDVDYACETAFTTYGTIGVKVWIYKGEVPIAKGFGKEIEEALKKKK